MNHDDDKRKHPRSLGEIFLTVLNRRRKGLPTSFYLLIAIPVVLVLGARMGYLQDDPRKFFLILSLMFLFFGVIFFRAILDMFDLIRKNVLGTRDIYKDTFSGDLQPEDKAEPESVTEEPRT